MEQLLLHLWGDYVTQSDWMANGKTSQYTPALVHAAVYSLPFLFLRPSLTAFAVILITHFFIDRFRLAKYVVYAKNFLAPRSAFMESNKIGPPVVWYLQTKYEWENCKGTGYPSEVPPFMAVWLMIIADNTMHLTINYLSLRYL